MKNRIKYILIGSLIVLSGCALDSEVYDKINTSNFPQSESDLNTLVAGNVYSPFTARDYALFFTAAHGFNIANEIVSDAMTCSWGNWDTFEFNSYEVTHPLVDNNFNQWQYYNYLGGMIQTLDRINNASNQIPEEVRARFMAETQCGIGFMAWLFYDLYGPIVIPDLETLKNPGQDKILPRTSKDLTVEFIKNNLEAAARVLPYNYESSADKGRFTKGLAKTLLMKLYMHEAEWNKAAEIGHEMVVTDAAKYGYKLADEYNDLFDIGGGDNAEVIYAARCADGFQNVFQAHVYPSDFPAEKYFTNISKIGVWGGYRMAWNFYKTYESGDHRLSRIWGKYTSPDGTVHNEVNDRKSSNSTLYWGAVAGKYTLDGTVGSNGATDLIIYRYADVKTLYSEALVRSSNAVSDEAKEYLNEVRTKHGKLPAYTDAELATPEKFLDKMLTERGHEFYMEGIRRQDLIRHGRFIEKALEKAREYGYSTAKIEQKGENGEYKYLLFPIPQSIMRAGQGQIKQNPGYK